MAIEDKRQAKQDWAGLRAWGCRGMGRLWWSLVGWWYGDRHIPLWPAITIVALVVLAILVARGL